ncbi:hypothetical protein D3C85_1708580 [compost metagenome]
MLLASIALEELALAHIMNAEAEKIQYVLGTLDSKLAPVAGVTLHNIMEVNQSVRKTLHDVVLKEVLLQLKLSSVLALVEMEKRPLA